MMMAMGGFLVIVGTMIGFVIGILSEGSSVKAYFDYKIEKERLKDQQEQRMEEYVKRQRKGKE